MPMGNRSWDDKKENYADGWIGTVAASVATAITGEEFIQPAILTHFSFYGNGAVASGNISLIDASSSADFSVTPKYKVYVATGATNNHVTQISFHNPIYFDKGIVIYFNAVTGTGNVGYKNRYE